MNTRTILNFGGCLLVAATLVGCGGSGDRGYAAPVAPTPAPTPTAPPATPTVTINIVGMNGTNSFSPNPATVAVGQRVAWHNSDNTTHTATADGGAFNTGNIAPGATSTPITMTAAGSLSYHCQIHPDMAGTVTVTP